jgi:hypothetical protein
MFQVGRISRSALMQAQEVACPRCQSAIGHACRSKTGKATTSHSVREHAYMKKIGTKEFARRHLTGAYVIDSIVDPVA